MTINKIAFSGFMAAILMSAGAASAAVQITSKDYVDTKVGAVDSRVTTNASAISTNAGNIATNAANIETNTADIAILKTGKQNTLTAANAGTGIEIAEEEGVLKIKSTYSDSALAARVTANEGNITTNTTDIATNAGNIETNTANIAANASAISTNAGNIATNTSDIASLKTGKQNVLTNANAGTGIEIAEEEGVLKIKSTYSDSALAARVTANETAINSHADSIDANSDAIDLLNGNATTAGSVDYKVDQAVKSLTVAASMLPGYSECIASADSNQCVLSINASGTLGWEPVIITGASE